MATSALRTACPAGVSICPLTVADAGPAGACWIDIGPLSPLIDTPPVRTDPSFASTVKCTGPLPTPTPELITIHGASLFACQAQVGSFVLIVNLPGPPAPGACVRSAGVYVH